MEMGLSRADANWSVSMSQWCCSATLGSNTSSKICVEAVQADHEHNTAEDRFFSSSAEGRTTNAAARLQTTFKHRGREESPLLRCEIVFTMRSLYAREDQLRAFPSTDDSEGTAYAGQGEHVSWTQQQ
ncbi:hypothetical protein TNCV_1317291 [Trichonephila clavipes]|nr:hypothetical protein TNCV_1317291 [Trichonephila clavipes]